MIKFRITLLFCFFLAAYMCAAQNYLLQVTVRDGSNNKPVHLANVFAGFNGGSTNEFGFISIPLTTMPDTVRVSHLGYQETAALPSDWTIAGNSITLNIYLIPNEIVFMPVEVTALRIKEDAPVTFTNIRGAQLAQQNFGEDMPMLLERIPNAVATSDAGNGIGYTGLRIRGSDATRVNISINGVPYNDAESQQSYWVDLPDFASSVDDIQVQRGIGTSTNGISAFGASVNINTNTLDAEPGVQVVSSIGSFGLRKFSANVQSGKINDHWYLEGRYSDIHSDGFIDRAQADLNAYFITTAYKSNKYSSILNVFSGKENTYQAWGGVPAEILDTNRTYNPYTYENQVDDYTQTHFQWHNIWSPSDNEELRITLNHTIGYGFYEQLEEEQDITDYGVAYPVIGFDTVFTSDMITQKWLDNQYSGAFIQYSRNWLNQLSIKTGLAGYRYAGDHFGKVIWSEYASTLGYDHEWYRNDALKYDANVFSQIILTRNKLRYFIDLQVRNVNYQFEGYDIEAQLVDQTANLLFFNPKIGVSYNAINNQTTYVYLGRAMKEPNRDDYVESTPLSRPRPEQLYNFELGHRARFGKWMLEANAFGMYYIDQLVLTGEINDVGAYTRTNIPKSYRTGIELSWSTTFFNHIDWNANFSFGQNKILEYTEYVDNWDDGSQTAFTYQNTDLAFSPSTIGYSNIKWNFLQKNNSAGNQHRAAIFTISKYVGQQYADNTGDAARKLDPYFLQDLGLNYTRGYRNKSQVAVNFIVQNLFDTEYESNAWVYRYIYDNMQQQMMGYYPQAGRNWVVMASFSF